MPNVSFSGLASGLDTSSIIQGLVNVERIPIQQLQAQNANYSSQLSIYDDLGSALGTLRTAATDLDTLGEFLSYAGSSSDDTVLDVTPSGDSVPGTYDVVVTDLARAQRTYSNAFADADAALSASDQTLSLTIDGVQTDITVTAGQSLRDVANAINSSGASATAGILFDGASYRLQVTGNETGASNAITFADSGLGLGLEVAGNTVQAATDAQLTIDGFAVTSSTNQLDDYLPGTTLDLKTIGSTTVTISPDSSAVEEKVQAFVDAYNSVFTIINDQVGEGKGADTLNGDGTLRTIEQGLQTLMTNSLPGLTDSNGDGLLMATLGITTGNDGTLSFDSSKLQGALSSDFQGTAAYFAGDDVANIDGMGDLMDSLIDSYVNSSDGLIEARKDGIQDRIDSNSERIDDLEAYVATFEENLQAQFTALEESMSTLRGQQQYLAQFLAQAG